MRHTLPFFLVLIVFGFSGCLSAPEFPNAPSISFNSAFFQDEDETDYIYLSINYKDGDGDLGLDKEDLLISPFTATVDSAGIIKPNRNHFNIFPVLLRKVGNVYQEITVARYDGIFPKLRDSKLKGPIEGTLLYKLGSRNFFGEDSSVAKIRVYIQDRALNRSNVIETPPFPVIYR